ncbi:serine/threonine exchanger [soil metagenome]
MTTKQLSLFDVTIITISFVIGMGIFRTPINVAHSISSPFVYYLLWIAGGLIALCGSLTFAEIGSRLPVTGGYYKIFSFAYHPSIAFSVNCVILVSNAASVAGVALVGAEYITGIMIPLFVENGWIATASSVNVNAAQMTIALSSIIIFYGVNLVGLKMSARTLNVLMIIKILLVILLITPLFFAPAATTQIIHSSAVHQSVTEYIKAFGVGLVAVSFTYGGYQQSINFGAEVREPRKTVPRGIITGMLLIIILYLLINYAYIRVIGFDQLKTSSNIAAIMASRIFGVNAERILSGVLFLGVLAYVNVMVMSNPRVMAAMSEDKILPPAFRKRNLRTNVLTLSLTVFSLLCAVIIFFAEQFDTILSFSIFLDSIGMVLAAASVFILRKRTSHLNKADIYTMKLYPVMPIIFITAYTFVAFILMITQTKLALIGIGVMIAFIILYFAVSKIQAAQKHLP